MIPLASAAARSLGKRMGKVTTEQMQKAGVLNTYLMEIFKNHKLMKIFQKENFEEKRAIEYINNLKETFTHLYMGKSIHYPLPANNSI